MAQHRLGRNIRCRACSGGAFDSLLLPGNNANTACASYCGGCCLVGLRRTPCYFIDYSASRVCIPRGALLVGSGFALRSYNERCITTTNVVSLGAAAPDRRRAAARQVDALTLSRRAAAPQGSKASTGIAMHACMHACPPARAVTMLACPQEPRRRRQGGTPPARRKHRASAAQCRACASGAPSSAATGRASTPVAAKRPRHPPPSLPRSGATGQHRQQQPQQQNRYTHPVPESYAAGSDAARQPNPLRLCDWNRRFFATE